MAIKLRDESSWGNFLIYIYSARYGVIQDAFKRIKKEFPSAENYYSTKSYSLFSLECRYTSEESLYPILQEISQEPEFISTCGFIGGFGIFSKDLYTEQFIFTDNSRHVDMFSVGTLTETTLDTIKAENEAFNKAFKRYMAKYSSGADQNNQETEESESTTGQSFPDLLEKLKNGGNATGKGPEDGLELVRKTFIKALKVIKKGIIAEDEKENLPDKNLFSGSPAFYTSAARMSHTYFFDGKGKVYRVNAFDTKIYFPYYYPFVDLFFATKKELKEWLFASNGIYLREGHETIIMPVPNSFFALGTTESSYYRDGMMGKIIREFWELGGKQING